MTANKSESASGANSSGTFFRRVVWAVLAAAVGASALAIFWLDATGTPLRLHLVIATILGVSATMIVGGVLMALVFHSARSGIDQSNGTSNDNQDNEQR